jgi:hypothetical protein
VRGRLTTVTALAALGLGVITAAASAATDGSYHDVYYVADCATGQGVNSAPAFSPTEHGAGISTANSCVTLGGLEIDARGGAANADTGQWATQTPSPSVRIIGVMAYGLADCNLAGHGFNASYFWGDNGVNYGAPQITPLPCVGFPANNQAGDLNQKIQSSRYFGWHAACTLKSGCQHTGPGGTVFLMQGIVLEAQETSGPSTRPISLDNLWYETGWVRGAWPMTMSASDPSGVCSMQTTVAGQVIASWSDPAPDTSNWTQCSGSQLPGQVDTTSLPDGPVALGFSATNAAGATSTPATTVHVDNRPVTVSVTSPGDALSTAGPQTVTATATAGPSGVDGIWCQTDGGAETWHPGASAQLSVQGIGAHSASCYAENNAIDENGVPARSATQTTGLSIRQPTLSAISFQRVADALRCRHTTKRIVVRIHGRVHVSHKHIVSCHPRTVRRKVKLTVTVRRHGRRVKVTRTKFERVVILPHVVNLTHRRLRFGADTSVHGWLGLADGTAFASQPIRVIAAPTDGHGQYVTVAMATTASDGSWIAKLPPGPSRQIEAVYSGSGTAEPAISTPVEVTVPAKVTISITPRHVPWGGKITIRGRVVGGYIPNSSKLLRLDIGINALHAIQGIPEIGPKGRFKTTYTFNRASGRIRFYFTVATLAEADYPYAPGSSRRITVTVGPGVR